VRGSKRSLHGLTVPLARKRRQGHEPGCIMAVRSADCDACCMKAPPPLSRAAALQGVHSLHASQGLCGTLTYYSCLSFGSYQPYRGLNALLEEVQGPQEKGSRWPD